MASTGDEKGRTRTDIGAEVRALLHPVPLLALLVLVVNDHVAKHRWPGLLTGKLSDVAGLIAAPAVLAVLLAPLLRRSALRPLLPAFTAAATGAGFALAKATAAGAMAASAAWSVVVPSRVVADPTDLVTLPALVVYVWVARRARWRPIGRVGDAPGSAWRRRCAVAVCLPLAVGALTATSARTPDQVLDVVLLRADFSADGGGRPAPGGTVLVVRVLAEGGDEGVVWATSPTGPWHGATQQDLAALDAYWPQGQVPSDGCAAPDRDCWRWGRRGRQAVIEQSPTGRGDWRQVRPDEIWPPPPSGSPGDTQPSAPAPLELSTGEAAGVVLPSGELVLATRASGLLVVRQDGSGTRIRADDLVGRAREEPRAVLLPGADGVLCALDGLQVGPDGVTPTEQTGRICSIDVVPAARIPSDQRPVDRYSDPPVPVPVPVPVPGRSGAGESPSVSP